MFNDEILNKIEEAKGELSGCSHLEDLSDYLSKIPEKVDVPIQLAIVGKISSSKSTLVNAILCEAEVVRTGEMEETWNVSWLKYGDPSDDILVHYKDGTIENVPRKSWSEWANRGRESGRELKDVVSYIEVTYDNEILKSVNIIDTPGLDSFYGKDSQNTLDFLNKVHPDAVIMLFSKSINADTLSIIEDFRQGVGAGLSPINALGVMAKIDNIWASDPELVPLREAGKICKRLMSVETVKNTLFDIMPISSLTALSSSTLNNNDFKLLQAIAAIDEKTLDKMFSSKERFVKEYENVEVTSDDRKMLRDKYELYSVFVACQMLKSNHLATLEDVKAELRLRSGFKQFAEVIDSHFKQRAMLIKSYSSFFEISSLCRKKYKELKNTIGDSYELATGQLKLKRAIRLIDDIIKSLTIEFNVVGVLKDIYDGKIKDVTDAELEELRNVNGDFGSSCVCRLQIDGRPTADELSRQILGRIKYWTEIFNVDGLVSPTKAKYYKLMINLYVKLLNDVEVANRKYLSSSLFLFGE